MGDHAIAVLWDAFEDGDHKAFDKTLRRLRESAEWRLFIDRVLDTPVEAEGDSYSVAIAQEGMNPQGPHFGLQWKGTDICGDFICECGENCHVDAMFVYVYQCPACERMFVLPTTFRMYPITKEQVGNGCVVRGELDEHRENDAATAFARFGEAAQRVQGLLREQPEEPSAHVTFTARASFPGLQLVHEVALGDVMRIDIDHGHHVHTLIGRVDTLDALEGEEGAVVFGFDDDQSLEPMHTIRLDMRTQNGRWDLSWESDAGMVGPRFGGFVSREVI